MYTLHSEGQKLSYQSGKAFEDRKKKKKENTSKIPLTLHSSRTRETFSPFLTPIQSATQNQLTALSLQVMWYKTFFVLQLFSLGKQPRILLNMVFLPRVFIAWLRSTLWLALMISLATWFCKPKLSPNILRSRYFQNPYTQNSLWSMRKAKNSHGHFSKRQQTKAHPGNLLIYLLQRKPSSLMTCLIINSVYWTQKTTNKPTAQTKSNPLKYTITSIVQLSHTDLHGQFFYLCHHLCYTTVGNNGASIKSHSDCCQY